MSSLETRKLAFQDTFQWAQFLRFSIFERFYFSITYVFSMNANTPTPPPPPLLQDLITRAKHNTVRDPVEVRFLRFRFFNDFRVFNFNGREPNHVSVTRCQTSN